MEPENQEWINKVVNHYSWDRPHDEEIDIQTLGGKSYKVVTSGPAAYRHHDLSSVSTRDLLNECYRRCAIEKFTVSRSVDSYMLQEHPNSMDYVMGDISRAVLDQVMSDKKFYEDALVVKQTRMQSVMSTDFEAEIYICKHPTKVKR